MNQKAPNLPDAADLERLAQEAADRLPDIFKKHLSGVRIRIEEFADEETLRALEIADPWELTGLYHGRPFGEQSIWSSGELLPVISLFRMPLLHEWKQTGCKLDELITHVVIHEVGHHFGLSDEEMEAIENDLM